MVDYTYVRSSSTHFGSFLLSSSDACATQWSDTNPFVVTRFLLMNYAWWASAIYQRRACTVAPGGESLLR